MAVVVVMAVMLALMVPADLAGPGPPRGRLVWGVTRLTKGAPEARAATAVTLPTLPPTGVTAALVVPAGKAAPQIRAQVLTVVLAVLAARVGKVVPPGPAVQAGTAEMVVPPGPGLPPAGTAARAVWQVAAGLVPTEAPAERAATAAPPELATEPAASAASPGTAESAGTAACLAGTAESAGTAGAAGTVSPLAAMVATAESAEEAVTARLGAAQVGTADLAAKEVLASKGLAASAERVVSAGTPPVEPGGSVGPLARAGPALIDYARCHRSGGALLQLVLRCEQ